MSLFQFWGTDGRPLDVSEFLMEVSDSSVDLIPTLDEEDVHQIDGSDTIPCIEAAEEMMLDFDETELEWV